MAAFSYQEEQHQYPPYLLDSSISCIPSSSASFFPYLFSFSGSGSSSSHRTAANTSSADDKHLVFTPPPLPTETNNDDDNKAPNLQEHEASFDGNKRKSIDETHRSKDDTNRVINKSRRQIKRPRGVTKKVEEKKQKSSKSSKACSNPSEGYVHVRARRGQATDSHSLAERVRREKISERMKMLQGLVPGCYKVTGKALMLDEIINYVQSLQNQVEFLSMKIASLSPVLYDFKVDFVDCTDQPQVMRSIPQALPSVEQTNHLQAKAFDNGTTSYQVMDHSTPHLMPVQGPTSSYSQDHGSTALQVGAQRQGFQDQLGFLSMCPFQ